MASLTTNGISISVETNFLPEKSKPEQNYYVYVYFVTITNNSSDPVQLLSRHWMICDGYANKHEVKGEGVIGQQPVLKPGEFHSYQSWSPLPTKLGKMEGSYTMQNLNTDVLFKVTIPPFILIHHDLEN